MGDKQGWELSEGAEIAPGRSALKRLGGGIRFEAYLAWDEHLYAIVVAKVLRPNKVTNESALKSLVREHEILARLNHPVLPRTFDLRLEGPRPHLVLEHLEGPRLSTLVRKFGWLPPEQLLPLAMQLCSALHYLSQENVVHLDVKPSNIIMSGPPRLIDLSLARTTEDAKELTRSVGTDDFMPPEQCLPGGSGVTAAADIWGLGATLYKAVTGALPFTRGAGDGAEPEQRWPALIEDPKPLPSEVPDAIAKPIMACLQKDPPARPTAAELHDMLEPLLTQLPKPVLGRLKPKLR